MKDTLRVVSYWAKAVTNVDRHSKGEPVELIVSKTIASINSTVDFKDFALLPIFYWPSHFLYYPW